MNKDKITNVIAIVMVVGGAIDTYLQSAGTAPIDWSHLGFAVLGAIVAYFTGKPNTPAK